MKLRVLLCLFLLTAAAMATTITFEGLPLQDRNGSNGWSYFNSVSTNGFTFFTMASSLDALWYTNDPNYCGPPCSTDGTFTLSDLAYNNPLVMTAQNSSPFQLNSFEVAGTFTTLRPGLLTVTGDLHSGGTLTDYINLGVPYNPNPFITINLPGWVGLDRVVFSMAAAGGQTNYSNAFAVDNVVVNDAPEPSSLLILAAGLAVGLGALQRKQPGLL